MFWPLGHLLSAQFGWRYALFWYAAIAVTTIPLNCFISDKSYWVWPDRAPIRSTQPLASTRRDVLICGIIYALATTGANCLNAGMSAHMIPVLIGLGLGVSTAVWITTMRGIGQSAARLCEIMFGRRVDPLEWVAPSPADNQAEILRSKKMLDKYSAYVGAEPYFTLVRQALGELVDGEHFFDVVAGDISYEVRYDLGWPLVVRGRAELMNQFQGYVGSIRLRSADGLIVNKADNGRVVVIEYDVHGTILATGASYENRFCSIIELENRKIARWRDYMDSHAAWTALTAKKN
ncbi:nuclear transport factor 2 family protein [Methylocystis bryophila]|uniref:nuclear transport factor 2 family protein n=1 Tax=Methylocystis bryophila TaxID=655015 RepID=UPI001FDAC1E0|nr:nuclear transport factor 2 family protein [Methylocystis bryophila]